MKSVLVLMAALASLAACNTAVTEDVARAAAKSVVSPIVAETVPGPTGVALSDCIIENASTDELLTLAGAATTGVNPQIYTLVSTILGRPETITCATSALAATAAPAAAT
jgi:hypothetical protein